MFKDVDKNINSASLLELLPKKPFQYDSKTMTLPTAGIISLTNRCNLECPYCFNHQDEKDMSFQTLDVAAKFLLSNAAIKKENPSISFFGGEPLLKFNDLIKPIINKYQDVFQWSITTNGTLLNEQIIDFLTENNVNVLLSIDGCETVQNIQRPTKNSKKKSFDYLKNIIPYLLIRQPNITFRSTLTKFSLKYINENLQTAIDFGFKNIIMIPNLFEEWEEEDFLLWKDFLDSEAIKIMQWISWKKDILYTFENLQNGVSEIALYNKKPELRIPTAGCGVGIRGIGISPEGFLHPCQEENSFNEKLNIGNVFNGINPQKHSQYLKSLYDKWVDYVKKVDMVVGPPNFKLQYANTYCSTRIKNDMAFCKTQEYYLRALHLACSRLFTNYSLSLNPAVKNFFNI